MFKTAKPLFLICETPLHVGSGDNLGIVDLPIQRERHTDFPKVESSSLKGALREAFEEKAESNEQEWVKIHATFGYDDGEMRVSDEIKKKVKEAFTIIKKGDKEETLEKEFAGCLGFTDARLLLFPVKSMKGVFAWITCPLVLHKFVEEMKLCDKDFKLKIPEERTTTSLSELCIEVKGTDKKKVVLEEYAFDVTQDKTAEEDCSKFADWLAKNLFAGKDSYWKTKISKDIVILPDVDFRDFVKSSTEVVTRTKINNKTGTVDKESGALFTEEFLPAESIMYSLVLASPLFLKKELIKNENSKGAFSELSIKNGVIEYFKTTIATINLFQLGGNTTLGKGIVRAVFHDEIFRAEEGK